MIKVSEPVLGDAELDLVVEAVKSGWVSSAGPFLEDFETQWAAACGREHGIAVSSGTTALQLAVATLAPEPGDEIIMPTFTIISCALAAIYNGCYPVFVDSDPETWCLDVEQVDKRISKRTRAIMPVHIYGHPADMDPLMSLAAAYDIAVIEDAAEAHGAAYLSDSGSDQSRWLPCGGMGDISTFSFYANKIVTTGEGGMCVTNDATLAERARSLRNLGFGTSKRFLHEALGFNFRLTNVQAALGVAQIERLEETVAKKRRLAGWYRESLQEVPQLQLPTEKPWARSVFWMYGVVVDPATGHAADELADQLRKNGVETRPFFRCLHQQPVLRAEGIVEEDVHPVAERLSRQGLYLPSGAALEERDVEYVAQCVKDYFAA